MNKPRQDERAKEPRVDRRIRVPEVLVIDAEGTRLGVLDTREALRLAEERGLNLVEVSPNSRPPVCRILDYGRYKYDLKQAAKKKKRNQAVIEVKEVKFRPKVEKHDFDFKVRHIERFLSEGNKVKATIMFRGRELAHIDFGELVLKRLIETLGPKILIEQPARLEGRNMSMQIAAKPGAWPKREKVRPTAAAAEPSDEEAPPELPSEDLIDRELSDDESEAVLVQDSVS